MPRWGHRHGGNDFIACISGAGIQSPPPFPPPLAGEGGVGGRPPEDLSVEAAIRPDRKGIESHETRHRHHQAVQAQ